MLASFAAHRIAADAKVPRAVPTPCAEYSSSLICANPSSAARALFGGAKNIERVDKLVQLIAKQKGKSLPVIDEVDTLVNAQLEKNRAQ